VEPAHSSDNGCSSDSGEHSAADSTGNPQAIVLRLWQPLEAGLDLIKTLTVEFPTVPILVITEQDRLSDRVAVSRLGIQRFLHQPIATAEVF
jgi:DNA-binding response OmpR family regulator